MNNIESLSGAEDTEFSTVVALVEALENGDKQSFLDQQTEDVVWEVDGELVPISPTRVQTIDLIPFAGNWIRGEGAFPETVSDLFDVLQTSLDISDLEIVDFFKDDNLALARINMEATVETTDVPLDIDFNFILEFEESGQEQDQIKTVEVTYNTFGVAEAFAGQSPSPAAADLNTRDPFKGQHLSINPDADSAETRQAVQTAYDGLTQFTPTGINQFSQAFADDAIAVYAGDPSVLPIAGIAEGKPATLELFFSSTDVFLNSTLNPREILVNGDRAAVILDLNTTAAGTNIPIDSTAVHYITVEDSLITNFQLSSDTYSLTSGLAGELFFLDEQPSEPPTGQIAYEGFPYLSNFVELSNGLNMHYLDEGEGDPIVLLHGLPSSSFLWRNIIPGLAEQGRVIVPDLINFGLSDKTEPLDFVEHGEFLSEFIDNLGLEDITYVLHDIGGPIGLSHIVDNPEEVKALALTETFVVPFDSLISQVDNASPIFAQFIDPVNRRTNVIDNNVIVEEVLFNPAAGSIAEEPTDAEKEVYRAPFVDPESREQFLLQVLEVPFLDTTGHPIFDPDGPGGVPAEPVPNIEEYDDFATFFETTPDVPKLLIASTPGNIIPPDRIPIWQDAIPGLEVLEIGSEENPGFHFLQEDLPEEFTAALAGWIDQINGEAVELTFGGLDGDVFELLGASNQEIIFTGAGDDVVDASQAPEGGNRLVGGTGLDELFAGQQDRVAGGEGDDILDASVGAGGNRLAGGNGDDQLFAGSGDRLFGGNGADVLDATAGGGDNRLYGQAGNDTFFAGSGDRLLGGDGDDTFFVNDGGDNLITGGAGADTYWIATGEFITTTNTITDFELVTDVIGVAGLGVTSIEDLSINQAGGNTIIAVSGFELATLLNTQANNLVANGTFVFT